MAKEYIEREAAINEFDYLSQFYDAEWGNKRFAPDDVETIIRSVPAADVVPVVRAKWEKRYNSYLKCSNCHDPYSTTDVCGCKQSRNFCPNCGAKMQDGDA